MGGVAGHPYAERAGFRLRKPDKVIIDGHHYGEADWSRDLYQLGGNGSKCVLRKTGVLGLDRNEWLYVRGNGLALIEFIDHEKNESWRIKTLHAAFLGDYYTMRGRERFGIPVAYFDVHDAEGNWVRRGV